MRIKLRKAVLISFLIGIAVACLVEIVGWYLNTTNAHPGMWWSTAVICVWPTSLALIETSRNLTGYVALIIAAIANGMVYAFIVLVIGYCISSTRVR